MCAFVCGLVCVLCYSEFPHFVETERMKKIEGKSLSAAHSFLEYDIIAQRCSLALIHSYVL